jgi:CelD/BcsL family acetyltransferase involved in cellulose biosynthesis
LTFHSAKARGAETLLQDPQFEQQWGVLLSKCPWATAYQTHGFVAAWYESYQDIYTPVLLYELSEQGELRGLLTLAVHKASRKMVVAGAHQAEYQGWLALPGDGNSFIRAALDWIKHNSPTRSLVFKYLPTAAPTDWAIANDHGKWRCSLMTHSRPLIRMDDPGEVARLIQQRKERRTNKYHLNKLKRLGNLRFERLREPRELEPIFDQLINFYDTRQASAHDSAPFLEDPCKKPFHLALLKTPDLLHVTVMHAGDQLISALVGVMGQGMLSLALSIFSPFHADKSPMTWHMLMLLELLQEENLRFFDLTPGLDPFKSEFASSSDIVNTLTVYFSAAQWLKHSAKKFSFRGAHFLLQLIRVQPDFVRRQLQKASSLKRQNLPRFFRDHALSVLRWLSSTTELRLYVLDPKRLLSPTISPVIPRDRLEDLLAYTQARNSPSKAAFLSDALKRLARGNHFYSASQNGQLLHCTWSMECKEKVPLSEMTQEFHPPTGSILLSNSLIAAGSDAANFHESSLGRIVSDVLTTPGASRIYFLLPEGGRELQRTLENIGFVYDRSFFKATRFGKSKEWSSPSSWHES